MRFFLLFLPLSLCAITTTLEFEDEREAASRAEITNEIASATNSLSQSAAAAHQSLAAQIASATNSLSQSADAAHQSLAAQIASATNGLISAESDPHALLRDAYSITTAGLITDWLIDRNLYGGVRIRYSSSNLDNYTAYAYNGVAVRRNNATQDFLFDPTNSNGIVRRAELDAYQPAGDYITVETDPYFNYFAVNGGTIGQPIRMGDNAAFRILDQDSQGKFGPDSFLIGRILYPASFTMSAVNNLANVVITATNAVHQSLASKIPTYAATNTTAVLAYNYGKETVAIPDGATLSADLSNWRDGEQCFVVLAPQGSYTPDASVAYNGYGLWPTNTALCVAWRYGATVYVNPVKIME